MESKDRLPPEQKAIRTWYSPEADAFYIRLHAGRIDYTEPFEGDDNRLVDYDENGLVLGVEILDAGIGIDLTGLPEAERIAKAAKKFKLPISAPA